MTTVQKRMSAPAAASKMARQAATKSQWVGLIIGAVCALSIVALPTPTGLARSGQVVLGIVAFTIALWVFKVVNNGVASVLMMALLVGAGIRPPLVLSGFASPQFWILLTILFYGCAMQRTNLARRVSFYILSLFPVSYTGILTAFLAIGLTLAFGIPSMTVRTAIIVPIAWALVQSLGIPARSRGAALVILTSIEMAVIPGCAFLYGSLFGPVVESVFQSKNLTLSWFSYTQVMFVPTMLLCALLIAVNQIVLRPEHPLKMSSTFVRDELSALGQISREEVITSLVMILSIAFWATDSVHHLPSYFIGMLALSVFALTGIVRDTDIATGISWSLLLFLGGIFGLATVIQEYHITSWLAGTLVPAATHLVFSPFVFVAAVAIAVFVLRFLDPTGFITITVLFLPLADVIRPAGIPPMVLTAPLILGSVPFWMSYENIWVAMGEAITADDGFDSRQRIRLAHAYAAVTVATLVVSVGFWKLIGVLQ